MSRTFSPAVNQTLWGRSVSANEIMLIEFDHPDLAAPIRAATDGPTRLADDPERYGVRQSDGTEWDCLPIEFRLPDDMPDEAPDLYVRLANINGESLVNLSLTGRITLRMRLVFSDDVDVTSMGPLVHQIDETKGTEEPPVFEGRVAVHPIYDELLVHRTMGPSEAPGIHRK